MSETTTAAAAEATTGGATGGGDGTTAASKGGAGKPRQDDQTPAPAPGGEPPLVTPKNAAGCYDNSHVWMVQIVILFIWLIYAMPVIKKFFRGMNPGKINKKMKNGGISSKKRIN